ncbi:MAG: hypothetical protein Tsb0013_06850 [Phycisphaerales bacterium]
MGSLSKALTAILMLALCASASIAEVLTIDAELIDPDRQSIGAGGAPDAGGRVIRVRIRYDNQASAPAPLILISHGGTGSVDGYTRGEHLGVAFAESGCIAMSVSHRASVPAGRHQLDRPADVSFVIDALESGALVLPDGAPAVDLARIGHTGHSYGAYTSHALGGATFEPPSVGGIERSDPRVDAIAPISPQGADQFGFFDRGPDDHSWASVDIPVCTFVGGAELDTNVLGTITRAGWRIEPYSRYSPARDRLLFVIEGQDHSDMWSTGSPEVEAFIAGTAAAFFEFTLRGEGTIGEIGTAPHALGVSRSVRSTDFNGDGQRDFFDVASHLDALEGGDAEAEMTGDRPVSLSASDAVEFIEALEAAP